MKFSIQHVKLALALSNYASAASLGYMNGANTKDLVLKREIDAHISPQQDPGLASIYGYANEMDASKGLRFELGSGNEQAISAKHVTRDTGELINGAASAEYLEDEYPVEDLEAEDVKKEDVIYQFSAPDSSDDDLDQVSVEQSSFPSSLKKLFSGDKSKADDEDDCDDGDDVSRNKRTDTKESENGKTIPDYFDLIMGDGDPEPPCSDDETEDGEQYDEYEHTYSKSDSDVESNDEVAAATLGQSAPAQILSSDPAEIIPFPTVRMYSGVAEIPVNDSMAAQNAEEGCESKGMPLQSPSALAIVCCTIAILSMGF